jgi:ring-1,2-phenylacetyl-CoA epoxidase subunit PaaE
MKSVNLKIKNDNQEFHLVVDGRYTLLDSILDSGIDVPWSCGVGVCSSCKCKLESGDVNEGIDYVLTEGEKSLGFILSCTSYPKSDNIHLNFDF